MVFSIFTELWNHYYNLILKHFHCSRKKPHTHLAVTSHSFPSLSHKPWSTINLLSVTIDLLILCSSYKWNHKICSLLWLASFTWNVFEVHPCCSIYQYFIPFYGQIIFHCMDISQFVYPFHLLMGIWVVSIFWLLWIMLL